MKMTSLAFIESFLISAELRQRVRDCILNKGRQPDQPRKWHKHLPKVPEYIPCCTDVDETLWVLIRYEGAFGVHSFSKKSSDLCQEVFQVPVGIQRAIKIDISYSKGVTWKLYQNLASDVKYKDVEAGIRTFKKV